MNEKMQNMNPTGEPLRTFRNQLAENGPPGAQGRKRTNVNVKKCKTILIPRINPKL